MRYPLFEDYQHKLATQEKYFQLFLYNPDSQKFYLYKPKMQSIYGTLEQKTTYYKNLRAKLVLNKQNTNKKISFVTLTYDTKLYSNVEVVNRCKRDMQLWLKLIRNRMGKINYFWIVELTKQNYVHFHIIFKEYIPAKIIRSCWIKTTGSIITDVKGVSRKAAAKYITKYISDATKLSPEQARFLYENNFKRLYANSKGFFEKRTKPKGIYKLIGIVSSPTCIISGNTGVFMELDEIALEHIILLLEQNAWGYVKKYNFSVLD